MVRATLSLPEVHHPSSLTKPRPVLLPATHPRINIPLSISMATICQVVSSTSAAKHPRLAFKKSLQHLNLQGTCFFRVTNLFAHESRLRPADRTSGADVPGLPVTERSRIFFTMVRNVVVGQRLAFLTMSCQRPSSYPA
jgi:hypothetical protein